MNRCPLNYSEIARGQYSDSGIKNLDHRLKELKPIPFSQTRLLHEAALRAPKMSVPGVQPKLSAVLEPSKSQFRIVDIKGRFILKPQNPLYPELPENEDLSMRMAELADIDIPLHGLIYDIDGKLTYFVKRFDRAGRKKIHVEDFAQLSGEMRETKYNSSVEKVIQIVKQYCTFPRIELVKLYRRILFNFLIGNEDMHLKNYSLISINGIISLSPGYDFLNSSIVTGSKEETALPIDGKKRKLNRKILLQYLPTERMELEPSILEDILDQFYSAQTTFFRMIEISFLTGGSKDKYAALLEARYNRILK